jgi:ABC-type transporter Mla MlaB component
MELISLELPDDLSIACVEEYKNQVISQIDNATNVKINDERLIKIDTVGVQLLLAIIHHLLANGINVEWHIRSVILIESIKQLGLVNSELNRYLNNELPK